MKIRLFILFWIAISHFNLGQTVVPQTFVPPRIAFADLTLVLSEKVRKILQRKIDSLKRNPQKIQLLKKRIAVYSSHMIPILEAQKVHSDFQYLLLLESGAEGNFETLDGVGFWQISESRATEIGLQTEKPDLRKHLIFSTQKIAHFFANNQYYLRNNLFSLLSHKIGLIQTNKLINNNLRNISEMRITENMDSYLFDFLSYFLVFKGAEDQDSDFKLWRFDNPKGYSTTQIANLTSLTTEEILTFNAWVLDVHKSYHSFPLLLPVQPENFQEITRKLGVNIDNKDFFISKNNTKLNYPVILNEERVRFKGKTFRLATINGLKGGVIEEPTSLNELAELGNLSVSKFLNFNDMSEFDKIQQEKVYYFESKKNTVNAEKHILLKEETFWDVAQKYGIKLNTLIKNNTIGRSEFPKAGRVLFLNKKESKKQPASEVKPIVPVPHILPQFQQSKDTLIQHTVQKEENLFQIAQKYKVSMAEIRNWNNLGSNLKLVEGMVLKILKLNTLSPTPKGTSKNVESKKSKTKATQVEYTRDSLYILHTIKKGEIPYQIAQKYNVTTEAILKWNNLKTNSVLLEGDKIRVKVRDGEEKKPQPFERQPIPITTYLVVKPESLTRIAYKLNLPVNRLAKWNPTQSLSTDLIIGTKLDLKDKVNVYNAVFGESIITIAKNLQIEARQLARWNHKPMISYAIGIGGEQLLLKPYGEKEKVLPQGYVETEETPEISTNSEALKSLENTKKEISEYYVLEPAQTLQQVAQKYNLSKKQLIIWNNFTASDLQQLSVGDTIYLNSTGALFAQNQQPWQKNSFDSPIDFQDYELVPADYHLYRIGETLQEISIAEAVSLGNLMSWNKITSKTIFLEGDTLLLTSPDLLKPKNTLISSNPTKYGNQAGAFYVVKEGEDIYTIADKFKIKVSELIEWNGLPVGTFRLRKGLRLIVQLRNKSVD